MIPNLSLHLKHCLMYITDDYETSVYLRVGIDDVGRRPTRERLSKVKYEVTREERIIRGNHHSRCVRVLPTLRDAWT